MEFFVALVIMAAIFGFAIAADRGAKARRRSTLDMLAAALGGEAQPEASQLTANRHGVRMIYRFADRGSGSSHEPWTDITVVIPDKYPLKLRVLRAIHVSARDMIDIEIGHPQFDHDFVIEAAPADVVRQLLDVQARAFLSGLSKLELVTGPSSLTLSVPGWQENVSEAINLVDGVARMGSRIRDAYAAADAAVAPKDVGSPYRSEVDQQPLRDAEELRKIELAQVEAVETFRREQAERAQRFLGLVLFGVVGFVMLLAVTANC